MLDTDTCIYAMSAAEGFDPKRPLQDCAISVVVLGELESGVRRSRRVEHNRAALDEWLAAVQVIDLNADVGRRYGTLRAPPRGGRPVDRPQRSLDSRPRAVA